MKIIKSFFHWDDSCFQLLQSFVSLLTLRYVYLNCELRFLFPKYPNFGARLRVWYRSMYVIPEELVEVLTLGHWSLG